MQGLIAIAGLLFVGAITPGPNNLIVLRQASRGGWSGALPSMLGVVGGGLTLLALVAVGVGGLFAAEPLASLAIAVVGGLYLAVLGGRLIAGTLGRESGALEASTEGLPAGARGLFVFQFLNPKGWILTLTVVAAAQTALPESVRGPTLLGLYLVIPISCLAVWALLGVALARSLQREGVKRWVDRVMGALLVGFALLLLIEQLTRA